MDIRRKTFAAEAAGRLGFLIQHGFAGPEVTQEGDYPLLIRVSYHRSDLDVRESLILSYGGEEYVMADVMHLNAAGGPAMRTKLSEATAHTGFQMRQALDRHAQVLREFLSRRQPGPPASLRPPALAGLYTGSRRALAASGHAARVCPNLAQLRARLCPMRQREPS